MSAVKHAGTFLPSAYQVMSVVYLEFLFVASIIVFCIVRAIRVVRTSITSSPGGPKMFD